MDSSETTGNGWMLLTALNLLSCGNQALIDCMTAASLPSTLVKCLYLFFDLPEIEDPDKCNPNSEFTAEERRALLQKIWVQVFCSFMFIFSVQCSLLIHLKKKFKSLNLLIYKFKSGWNSLPSIYEL